MLKVSAQALLPVPVMGLICSPIMSKQLAPKGVSKDHGSTKLYRLENISKLRQEDLRHSSPGLKTWASCLLEVNSDDLLIRADIN